MIIFNHTAHKQLWNYLAEHPHYDKSDWFEEEDIEDIPQSYCYACETAYKVSTANLISTKCSCCPFHNLEDTTEGCLKGIYYLWEDAINNINRANLAEMIRDYPLNEEHIKKYNIKVI